MNIITRRSMALVLLIVTIGVLILIVFRLFGNSSYDVTQYYGVPRIYQAATAYSPRTMVFSNNRSFVTYNYVTGATHLLSPDSTTSGLLNIDSLSVSQNKDYLLFHDMEANPGGSLYNVLVQQGLSTTTPYWWIYSTASQTFKPVPGSPIIAKFNGNNLMDLENDQGQEKIVSYQLPSFTTGASIAVSSSDNYYPSSQGLLLHTVDNSILKATSNSVASTIFKNTDIIGVRSQEDTAIGLYGQGSAAQLTLLNLKSQTNKTIASDFVGQPAWSSQGVVLYTSTQSPTVLASYNYLTNKTTPWVFTSNLSAFSQANLTLNAAFGGNTAIVSANPLTTFLIGSDLHPVEPPTTSYLKVLAVQGSQVTIDYSEALSSFQVSYSTSNVPAMQQAVYAQLVTSGYSPYLEPINYISD